MSDPARTPNLVCTVVSISLSRTFWGSKPRQELIFLSLKVTKTSIIDALAFGWIRCAQDNCACHWHGSLELKYLVQVAITNYCNFWCSLKLLKLSSVPSLMHLLWLVSGSTFRQLDWIIVPLSPDQGVRDGQKIPKHRDDVDSMTSW